MFPTATAFHYYYRKKNERKSLGNFNTCAENQYNHFFAGTIAQQNKFSFVWTFSRLGAKPREKPKWMTMREKWDKVKKWLAMEPWIILIIILFILIKIIILTENGKPLSPILCSQRISLKKFR